MRVGLFDSGVGGLSILRDIWRLMPGASTVYFADTANFPYGTKSEDEVRRCSLRAVDVLMKYHPSAMVVACNTASTIALEAIRKYITTVPIVGVVPALKPAVAMTITKNVAVLATERTLASRAYQELKKSFADGMTIIDQPCPGWVELVENGQIDDAEAEQAVRDVVEPLAAAGVDVYVLGCTHYPWLRPLIEKCVGQKASTLDSGEAVAKKLQRVLGYQTANDTERQEIYLTSGNADGFQKLASRLLGRDIVLTLYVKSRGEFG
ncbi:MAG: glutamate racemase [Patescibacteria group bacterium]